MAEYAAVIVEKIKAAAHSRLGQPTQTRCTKHASMRYTGTEKLIGIGASTGGTEAIKDVIMHFPRNAPATIISQHMPPGFTTTYAKRLDSLCEITVREAHGGERLLPGFAYLAPGNKHLKVERSGADYRLTLDDGPKVSGHKPSVDVMFDSRWVCCLQAWDGMEQKALRVCTQKALLRFVRMKKPALFTVCLKWL